MKQNRTLPQATISEKAENSLKQGHVWVFDTEILTKPENTENGDLCDVYSKKGAFLGTAFYNENSLIRLRLISKNANETFATQEAEESFWRRRVQYAIKYRLTVLGIEGFSSCRLIFGEADGFPGLTVDKFETVLVVQCLCLGLEKRKVFIYKTLVQELKTQGFEILSFFERNDSPIREKEGLSASKGFLTTELGLNPCTTSATDIIITENGIKYSVDFAEGQKTGFFLDQRENRLIAASIASGKTVLDCFTHTGSFGLNCLKAGAKHVTFVDVSESAIEKTKQNVVLNGFSLEKCSFVVKDAFDFLQEAKEKNTSFDLVILDPPAFTKSSKTRSHALSGYKALNKLGMAVTKRGNYLATATCSHFVSELDFQKCILQAAQELQLSIKQIKKSTQAPDHPIIWSISETSYLKFFLLQLI